MSSLNVSIVSPVYQAEGIVSELVRRIMVVMEDSLEDDYEIILVDDGSKDASWEKIQEICSEEPRVKGIKLSRNFGQHVAITAGLSESDGARVVVMDCDLQDDPSEIPKLLNKADEGFDIVLAQRVVRKDSFLKTASSALFYKAFGYMTDTVQDRTVANFGVYSRNVVDAILSMGDHTKYLPTMCQWVGFDMAKMEVNHNQRFSGTTSYSVKKLMSLAVNNMISFSDKPLWLIVKIGLSVAFVSFVIGLSFLYRYIFDDIAQPGFTSIIISIWFLGGFLMVMIGLVGIYVGKMFEHVKQRPTYIVSEKLNVCAE